MYFYEPAWNDGTDVYKALMDNLPRMAVAQALIRKGDRAADLSLSVCCDLVEAVDVLGHLRSADIPVSRFLADTTLIKHELTPFQKQLLWVLDGLSDRPFELRRLLDNYAERIISAPMTGEQALPSLETQAFVKKEVLFHATVQATVLLQSD